VAGDRSAHAGPTDRRIDAGFSLVELMTVVLIVAALVTIAVPVFTASHLRAEVNTCAATRSIVETADHSSYVESGQRPAGVAALVGGYLKDSPRCPSGGVYVWLEPASPTAPARTLGCSVHYFPVSSLTPLGSSFPEISTNMIKLLTDYYAAHGSWPRSFSPYNYTDLGLDPTAWASPVDHLYYSTSGSRVAIRPEAGYRIDVVNTNGKTLTLTNDLKWSLWYSALDGTWYYKNIASGQEIEISSMSVTPQ